MNYVISSTSLGEIGNIVYTSTDYLKDITEIKLGEIGYIVYTSTDSLLYLCLYSIGDKLVIFLKILRNALVSV